MGSNHDGDLERAKKLIDIAVNCGVDAVKFQLIPPFLPEWINKLISYCGNRIEFMATPFNENGIEALRGKVKHWKISSTEAANKKFVEKVFRAAGANPVFVSDGAVDKLDYSYPNLIPLCCVVKYPAEWKDYSFPYKGNWGVSDHTTSLLFPAIVTAMGAKVIEKHFTDDNKRKGADHPFSVLPEQLKGIIVLVRMAEALSNNKKTTIKDYVGRKIEWP